MQSEIFTYVLLAGLAIALVWVIVTDLRSRTISNRLTLTVALGAPLYWLSVGLPLWPGIAFQVGLAVVVFAVCCILFAIRQMGGGDVKLLTALALWFPPTNFLGLVLIMAMVGWVLTLAMGIWGVARSNVLGGKPVRDTFILVACTLIAGNFASAVLGGPKLAIPSSVVQSLGTSETGTIAIALIPIALLAIATLVSIRIIRRHKHQPRVPYGLAISVAGLWMLGGSFLAGISATAAG